MVDHRLALAVRRFCSPPSARSGVRAGRTTLVLVLVSYLFVPTLRAQWEEPGESREASAFRLFGDRDFASSGLRMKGDFTGCTDNSGSIAGQDYCWSRFHPSPLHMPSWHGIFLYVAAPPSERDKHAATVPSLANANNKGYTVNSALSQYTGEVLPVDGTLGPYHSGVIDSGAGDCQDFRTIPSGWPLLAASDCEPTWGTLGWQGTRPVDARGYLAHADRVGDASFRFDPWRVPEELHREDAFLGDFQTFGFFSDYSSEALLGSDVHRSYGNVIPGGVGDATRSGWPLGMLAKMDAYTFTDPNVENTAYFQITVTNNSREVYGVGLDYDSLYMGLQPGWHVFNHGASLYRDPANGVIRGAAFCQGFTNSSSQGVSGNGCGPGGDPQHPATSWGSAPPEGVGAGFNYGASAIVVLKSPIGDLRNRLFSDPQSRFFGRGDPGTWDDTITFNHGHMCGFHGCSATIWNAPGSVAPNADYEQRQFGMVASITRDVVGDREPLNSGSIGTHTAWDTWRWEEYPDRTQLDFNKWVPGFWDYNEDGVADTLFYDDCSGNAGPQYDPFTGNEKRCSVAWSDTLPGGFGNLYASRGAVTGVGPISLPADSTVQWVIAVVHGGDLEEIESGIAWTIRNYMTFYAAAWSKPAPAPGITSVEIESGGEGLSLPTEPEARATFYIDDAAEAWEDPRLQAWLEMIQAAPLATAAGTIRALNPWVEDTIQALIGNNVAAIHVFKSCDGVTYTDDDNCEGDPAVDGKFAGIGWYPWRTLEEGVVCDRWGVCSGTGDFPNIFEDEGIFTGQTFLYSLVTETRGLTVPVTLGVADTAVTLEGDTVVTCVSECRTESLEIASVLYSPLTSVTTKPQVTVFYVPASRQAGSSPARFELIERSPDLMPLERLGLVATADEVVDGEYRMRFGDSVTVTEYWSLEPGRETLDSVGVEVFEGPSMAERFGSPGVVGVEGEYSDTIVGDEKRRTYPFRDLAAVLVDSSDVPLLVTQDLRGGQTVPGRYFGLANYPGFTLSIDNRLGGAFEGQYYVDAEGERIGPLVEPSVTFRPQLTGSAGEGRYRVIWSDRAFGPGSPFALDLRDPVGTRAAVRASLAGRSAATASSVDPDLLSYLGVPEGEVLEVRLPFAIENVSDPGSPAPVTVLIRREDKRTSLLLGVGLDTLIVEVPETEWLPGDRLLLVEGSVPDLEVTFVDAVIGCDAVLWLRTACNPLALGGPGATGYIPNGAEQELHFSYYRTITSRTEHRFTARSAVAGNELQRSGDPDRIRAALDSVKVVPNPFILYSRYNMVKGPHHFILFTHVPPRGLIRVYTSAGQFVQLVRWGPSDLNGQGDLRFYLLTREGLEMAAGLYLYVLHAKDEAGNDIGVKRGKFVLIR